MQIYVKTPLVNYSQTIPHMVEHCSGRDTMTPNNFFWEKVLFSKEIIGEWTKIFFDKNLISVETVLKKIQAPLLKSVYEYEKIPFKQECENMGQWSLIYESMLKKIIDPKISINSRKGKTWENVVNYHKQYYTNENILIFEDEVDWDEEFSLIFAGQSYQENKKYSTNEDFFSNFSFDWQNFFIIGTKNYNVHTYWKLIFAWTILENFCKYLKRYHEQSYFYEETTLDTFRDYLRITTPKIDYSLLTESFFKNGKTYIINMLENWYFKEKLFLANHVHQIPASRNEVIKICQNFQRDDFNQKYLFFINMKDWNHL